METLFVQCINKEPLLSHKTGTATWNLEDSLLGFLLFHSVSLCVCVCAGVFVCVCVCVFAGLEDADVPTCWRLPDSREDPKLRSLQFWSPIFLWCGV